MDFNEFHVPPCFFFVRLVKEGLYKVRNYVECEYIISYNASHGLKSEVNNL